MNDLILLPAEEAQLRATRLARLIKESGFDIVLIASNAEKYWLTGRVFAGWITVDKNATIKAFVKRPVKIEGDNVTYSRKHEDVELPYSHGTKIKVGMNFSTIAVSDYNRLTKHFKERYPDIEIADSSTIIRQSRAVKTPYEIAKIEESGRHHVKVNKLIPELYRKGMTDLQLQIEIERALRLEGCLGQFRVSGDSMELFMGNILAGDNADNPTPFDFAMGGAGVDPSLPVGADNTVIRPGMSVMVDANGNFTGYMTDMTRTFYLKDISDLARKAHECSIDICRECAKAGVPGKKASELYELAMEMAENRGLKDYFMGHHQKAGFIGHGVGIEINEAPVLAPRSRDIITEGNVIAIEPKFVIPGTGAVGIENTYVVTAEGMRCITPAPEELIAF